MSRPELLATIKRHTRRLNVSASDTPSKSKRQSPDCSLFSDKAEAESTSTCGVAAVARAFDRL